MFYAKMTYSLKQMYLAKRFLLLFFTHAPLNAVYKQSLAPIEAWCVRFLIFSSASFEFLN